MAVTKVQFSPKTKMGKQGMEGIRREPASKLAAVLTLFIFGLSCAPHASARQLQLPVMLSHEFVTNVLHQQLFKTANHEVRVHDDGTGCNFLSLASPILSAKQGYLQITADAEARIGTAFADQCFLLASWTGKIEVLEEFHVSPSGDNVRARVVKSNLFDRDGKPAAVSNAVWQWVTEYVHPSLETVLIDLSTTMATLREFLPDVLAGWELQQLESMLASLRIDKVNVIDEGLGIDFALMIPDRSRPAPSTDEAPLSPQEIEQLTVAMNQLDAFLTVIAKHAAHDSSTTDLRLGLLDVVLDTRHDIVFALSAPTKQAQDPVKAIFLTTWQKLAPLLRRIGGDATSQATGLHYLSFVAAADALRLLDDVGPEMGVDISTNGLRRLARMLIPDNVDPLEYRDDYDPELRKSFGFDEELPPPQVPSVIEELGTWLFRSAIASTASAASGMLDPAIVERLNGWVPVRTELDEYLPKVDGVLRYVAEETLAKSKLDVQFHAVFRAAILSAAWKESCWRQFVLKKGKRQPLLSGVGAAGVMQVLPRVWRGFYNVKGLKWDFAYNARAGSEIFMHYFRDYAVKKGEHRITGNPDNLARATYAAYNAGPSGLTRYRKANPHPREKIVDNGYFEKYLAVKQGRWNDVRTCY